MATADVLSLANEFRVSAAARSAMSHTELVMKLAEPRCDELISCLCPDWRQEWSEICNSSVVGDWYDETVDSTKRIFRRIAPGIEANLTELPSLWVDLGNIVSGWTEFDYEA